MRVLTAPSRWTVTLREGSVLTVWAAAFSIEADEYVFSSLVEATPAEQADLDIVARTPANVAVVDVVVARLPVSAVSELVSAEGR